MSAESPLLVFGDDGSSGADVAWLWVNNQPWEGWRIDVVHASPPPVGPPPPPERSAVHEVHPADGRTLMGGDAPVRYLAAEADPRAVLGAMDQADLMVVGARGRGLFKSLRLGSTSDWLLQCPPAPLLVVRGARPVRTAVVCIDGSAHAHRAAATLAALPLAAGLKAVVLSVGRAGGSLPEDVEVSARKLRDAGAQVEILDRTPDPLEPFYDVRNMILDVAADTGADLLVFGTRGLSTWKRLGVGSIASALARHAPMSVLMAHQE